MAKVRFLTAKYCGLHNLPTSILHLLLLLLFTVRQEKEASSPGLSAKQRKAAAKEPTERKTMLHAVLAETADTWR